MTKICKKKSKAETLRDYTLFITILMLHHIPDIAVIKKLGNKVCCLFPLYVTKVIWFYGRV